MPPNNRHTAKRRLLDQLRAKLARLERSDRGPQGEVLPLDLAGIERALPGGGLARGALHELHGEPGHGAAAGFAAALLGRFASSGHVLWIVPRDDLFAPGLLELGLPPERLIVVAVRPRDARLWALEEALRSPGLVAALSEVDQLTLTQSRRLQLAAEAKGGVALLLRPTRAAEAPSAALTRWRISSDPSASRPDGRRRELGAPRWRVELFRCRGGRTGTWQIEWRKEGWHEITHPVPLVASSGDRSDQAQSA